MSKTKNQAIASMDNIYSLDGRVPLLKSIHFGLQHVLAMFVANIAPIMIVTGASGLSTQETAVLIQTAEGTPEEVTVLDPGELFGSPEELEGIRSVLLMIKFPPSGGLDHVTAIAERVCTVFPPDCTVIWGVSFDDSSADRAKVCIAGVY